MISNLQPVKEFQYHLLDEEYMEGVGNYHLIRIPFIIFMNYSKMTECVQ